MDYFQALDQRWTPLLLVCGVPLVVLGFVIRLLSARRSLSWRVGYAAVYLGMVLVGIAAVFHFVLPYVVAKTIPSFPGR
jgi:hypothetical protein